MRRYMPILLCLLLTLMCGCFDRDPQLTEPTGSGANSLSCKVDGQIWEPVVPIFYMMPHLAASTLYEQLYVEARSVRENNSDGLHFTCDTLHGIGPQKILSAYFFRNNDTYQYLVPDSSQIYVTTLDTAKRIVSGRFLLMLRNKAGTVIRITDGRFDLRYDRM